MDSGAQSWDLPASSGAKDWTPRVTPNQRRRVSEAKRGGEGQDKETRPNESNVPFPPFLGPQ